MDQSNRASIIAVVFGGDAVAGFIMLPNISQADEPHPDDILSA